MEQMDLENIDYNQLYKIHTGYGIYDSDSDSSDSMASAFLEQHKPPLYTYEELKANMVIVEVENEKSQTTNMRGSDVGSKALKSKKSPKETQEEILKKLILPDYCYVCYADLSTPHNAVLHYNSMRHKYNVKSWKASVVKSPEEIVQGKLKGLICSDYCYICNANLPQYQNANSHYSSNRHKNNVDSWTRTEIQKLQGPNDDNLVVSKKVEPFQQAVLVKPANKNDTGKSKNNNSKDNVKNGKINVEQFCSVCGINTSTGLQDHYKTDLHMRSVETFCFICNIKTSSKGNFVQHIKGKSHEENLRIKQENKNSLTITKTIVTPVAKKATPDISAEIIVQDKLKNLLSSDYCYICGAELPQLQHFDSHYSSNRHKNNLKIWKSMEIKRLQLLNLNSLVVSKSGEHSQPAAIQKQANDNNVERLEISASIRQKAEPGSGAKSVIPNNDPVCRVCGINIHSKMQDHYNNDLHKRSVETFCFVCDVRTASKEKLAEHGKSIIHMDNLRKNNDSLSVPQTIVTPTTKEAKSLNKASIIQSSQSILVKATNETSVAPLTLRSCNICNIHFGNDNIAKEHYKSVNHQRKVELSEGVTQALPKIVPIRWYYCDVCKMLLDSTIKAEKHYKDPDHIIKNNSFYCHICKLKFTSKIDMDYHMNSFPHNEVSKLKSLTVSKGIWTHEFWKYDQFKIQCNLCNVCIQSESSAFDHFGSKRHVSNFDEWCCDQLKDTKGLSKLVPLRWCYCDVCKMPLNGTEKAEEHYKDAAHIIKYSIFDCRICKLKFTSKMDMDYHNSFPHNEVVKLKSLTVSKGISTQEFWKVNEFEIQCNLCNAHIQSESSAFSHFASKKHVSNFDQWCCDQLKNTESLPKLLPNHWSYCDVCKIPLNGTEKAEEHYKESAHILKIMSFHCYVCKMTFAAKIDLDLHINSFPHNEVSKLKSLTVSKGISIKEFWKHNEVKIQCNLCNACIYSESSAFSHFESKKHVSHFDEWCCDQIKDTQDPNKRWYFCDICNQYLNGTTNIEFHYQGIKHAKHTMEHSSNQHLTASNKSIDDTTKEIVDERERNNTPKTQQEEIYRNSAKPILENQNINTKVTKNTINVDNESKKHQEVTEQKGEDIKLQTETVNLVDSDTTKHIPENRNVNIKMSNNEIHCDNKNKVQNEETEQKCEDSKLSIEQTKVDYSDSAKPVTENQNLNTKVRNNKMHFDSNSNKQQEETEQRCENSNHQIERISVGCNYRTKPILENQNINNKITNNKINSDNENKKQQEVIEQKDEDIKLQIETIKLIDSDSTKHVPENQNLNTKTSNNEIHSNNQNKKQKEETEQKYEESKLSIERTKVNYSNSAKPVTENQNLNTKITNNNIHSDNDNNKQQQETEQRNEDSNHQIERIHVGYSYRIKPISKNPNINNTMTTNKINPHNENKKQQEETKREWEDIKLQIKRINGGYSNTTKPILENQNINDKMTDNKINSDVENKKQQEETERKCEDIKHEIKETIMSYRNSVKPILDNQNINGTMTNNNVYSDIEMKKQQEETKRKWEDTKLQIKKTIVDCSNSTKPTCISENQNMHTKMINSRIHSDNDNKKQQEETKRKWEDTRLQIERINMIPGSDLNNVFYCYFCRNKFNSQNELKAHFGSACRTMTTLKSSEKDTTGASNFQKSYSEKIKYNDAEVLREMVQVEMEKFLYTIKTIPPKTALQFLRKANQELKNMVKKPEVIKGNVKSGEDKIGFANFFENQAVGTKWLENHNSKKMQYVSLDNQSLNNEVTPVTFNYSIFDLFLLSAVVIIFLNLFML